jgi:hypothetical protein
MGRRPGFGPGTTAYSTVLPFPVTEIIANTAFVIGNNRPNPEVQDFNLYGKNVLKVTVPYLTPAPDCKKKGR